MKKKTGHVDASLLRKKAEELLASRAPALPLTAADAEILTHELQVHQIELEMQNEELRQSRLALENSNKRFSDLYDFAPVGYVTMDRASKIIESNLTVSVLLEFERINLIGKPFNVFVSPDDKDLFHLHRQGLAENIPQVCEIRLTRRNGDVFYAQLVSTLYRDAAGLPPKIMTAVFDISASKTAESKVAEHEAKFRVIFENNNDAILIVDLSTGRYIDCNPRLQAVFGYTHEEICAAKAGDLLPFAHKPESLPAIETIKRDGVLQGETEITTKYGTIIPVDFNAFKAVLGNRNCIVVVSRDMTERKRLHEEIRTLATFPSDNPNPVMRVSGEGTLLYANRASNFFLKLWKGGIGRAVPENIRNLINETCSDHAPKSVEMELKGQWFSVDSVPLTGTDFVNLYLRDITKRKHAEENLARRAAELTAANQGLEAFAYSVSHDLRNPLHAILTLSDVLKNSISAEDKDNQEALDYIKSSGKTMAQIIDGLMSLSMITLHGTQFTRCSLSDMAKSIIDDLKQRDSKRKVSIVIEPRLYADADEGLVKMLLQNLLQNAWKFTSKRKAARIEFGEKTDGVAPVFYIRDNGTGFDMARADNLFKPFQRLHAQEEYPGTGIGLSIVKRIIEKHGGTVTIEAEKDKGATVYFSLSGERTRQA